MMAREVKANVPLEKIRSLFVPNDELTGIGRKHFDLRSKASSRKLDKLKARDKQG